MAFVALKLTRLPASTRSPAMEGVFGGGTAVCLSLQQCASGMGRV